MFELSKQRLTADNQFLKIQTRALSRARIMSETEKLTQQREDNMLKLRGLRLANETSVKQAGLAAQIKMKSRRRPGFK
ncbi:hypothetical protein [Bosea robiniae]|uniref:hypothetical protein n=1 Tax=Bosea robiniae TaxID=1036780 RepID=UPI00111407EB|nr:hypothetical protein [Bosea robiniae]